MTKEQIINYVLEILKITIPAVVSVGVVMLARWLEKKKEYDNQIREKKIVIYEKFVMNTLNFLLKSPSQPPKKQEKMLEDLALMFEDFHKNLLFWGSDDVIKAYNHYRFKQGSIDARMEDFEDLILAFRKDVGHNNKRLEKFDILKMLLKVDEFDKKGRPIKSTLLNSNKE